MSALNEQPGGTHYKQMAIQPVQYIHANDLGYCEANIVKYVSRWRDKNGIEDLLKARHYIDLLIELEGLQKPEFGQQNTIDCRTDAENVQQPGPAWTLEARRCLVCFGEHGSAPCPQTRITASVVNDPRTVVGLDLSFPTEKHMNFAPACEHVFDINGWREAEGGSKQWFSKCSKCGVEVDSE